MNLERKKKPASFLEKASDVGTEVFSETLKKTRAVCLLMLLTGCSVPAWSRISPEEALQEFSDEVGDNHLLEGTPAIDIRTSNDEIPRETAIPAQTQPSGSTTASSDGVFNSQARPSRIPSQQREYRVTEHYFDYPRVTSERLGTSVLMNAAADELFQERGAAWFLGALFEDIAILSTEERQVFVEWLEAFIQRVRRNYDDLKERPRGEKIATVFRQMRERHEAFFPDESHPEYEYVTVRPNAWGLLYHLEREAVAADISRSLVELDDNSLDQVLFFSIVDTLLAESNARYSAGSLDIRDLMHADEPTFDCNTISTLRAACAIECGLSESLKFHNGLSRVEGGLPGHAYLSLDLQKRSGATWTLILTSQLAIPAEQLNDIFETEHEISYGSEGLSGDINLLLSGFYEHVFRSFGVAGEPLLHFWEGMKIITQINSHQAALAAEMISRGCLTGPESENMIGVASVILPVVLRDRHWARVCHEQAPERSEYYQDQFFGHTTLNLLED